MNDVFKNFPYYPSWTFSSIAAGTNNSQILMIPRNVSIYGITIQARDLPENAYYEYTIQFQDYETGNTLFDEPIQAFNIQTNVRAWEPGPDSYKVCRGFKLPSEWWIKKSTRLVCKLNTFASSTTETYYVTLLGYVCDSDPNPGRQPFVYSYPMNLGFQDNANASGQTSVNFNQQVCNTLGKHMLMDFELHAITLDPWGTLGFMDGAAGTPFWSFNISLPGRKLADRMIIDGCWGGGTIFNQGNSVTINGGSATNLLDDNVFQYRLAEPIVIPKRQVVRVDISPAVTYVVSNILHFAFNQKVCMALIGNHLA